MDQIKHESFWRQVKGVCCFFCCCCCWWCLFRCSRHSRWQCYSSHHRIQRVCYSLLLRLLRTIDAEWDPPAVRGDLVGSPPSPTTQVGKEPFSSSGNSHLISSAPHWHSSRFLVQPKMSHSQCTWSYNWGPFLCPGEAAVRQLQAVHRALPVPDEEHASGFPLLQRRCHYTLRAHAEVKFTLPSHHVTHSSPPPRVLPH